MEQVLDPYPLPNNVHVSSTVTVKLTDQNYLLWKPQIESLLTSQKLIGFVDGREKQPPATISVREGNIITEVSNPKFEAWVCTDHLIRSWLFGTLSEEVLGYVVGFQTSKEIWMFLAENFNRSSLSRVFQLRRSLQMISKNGKSFSEYCRDFRKICDQLSSIGQPIDENMKVFNFLNGLGRDYDPITAVIQNSLSRHPPPTFNDVVSEVGGFDSRLQSYEEQAVVNPHMAFQTQRFTGNGYRGRGRHRGRGGFTSRGRGFSQQVNNSSSFNSSQRPTCQICGRVGHTALKCYNRFDNNYQSENLPEALAAFRICDNSGEEWYPDSGATAHITSSPVGLQNVSTYNGAENVMVADGNNMAITHVGSTNLTTTSGVCSGSGNSHGVDTRGTK